MEIFGYDKNDTNYKKLIKLSQASICCNKKDLEEIISFLTNVRDNYDNDGHWHYRDHNKSWTEKESDLIICLDRFDDAQK